MELLVKINERGQITLPGEFLRKLEVKEGGQVFLVEEDGRVILENAVKFAFRRAREDFAGEAERLGLKTDEDVVAMIKKLRQEAHSRENHA